MAQELCSAKQKPDIRELTLANGISFPSDHELLMLLLGSGTKDVPVAQLAQRVLSALEASNEDTLLQNLQTVTGMGINRSLAVAAAIELGRRRSRYRTAVINTPSDIIPYVKQYTLQKREHFVCTALNGAHEILAIYVVSVGTVGKTIIHPREVFSKALSLHASAIICCHNHPYGPCFPSTADRETTIRLQTASEYLGISFLDHLIITTDDYFSFREHDLLQGR